jgi:hypothetical protein
MFDARSGHNAFLDGLLIVHSWLSLLLVWVVMWLSREVGNVIHPRWITEALYGFLLAVHFIGVTAIVIFQFMDVDHGRKHSQRKKGRV